jgi:hypothetical protein
MKRNIRQLLEKAGIIGWMINHKFMAGPKITKNLNQIISVFTDITGELKELKERHRAQMVLNHAEVRRLQAHTAELNSEHDRANNVHENLERLFQPAQSSQATPAPQD